MVCQQAIRGLGADPFSMRIGHYMNIAQHRIWLCSSSVIDCLFYPQMLAKFAEDDRIEQMNAQKRRMKQLEHKRAVEQLLMDRRAQFAAEREREIEERKEAGKMEEFKRALIEEERQKLLRQHAQKLLGYLPKVCTGYSSVWPFKFRYLLSLI